MRNKRGSVTVISLVFLLFLFIIAGSWIIMMTQEKANAMGDEKQQQAWYAAEAGYKRALNQIKENVGSSVNMSWLNTATNFKSDKVKHYDLATLTESSEAKEQGPWYAVTMKINDSEVTPGTVAIVAGAKCTITVMGQYMGERKIIQRTYTTSYETGGDGGASKVKDDSTGTVTNTAVIAGKTGVSLTTKASGSTTTNSIVYSDGTISSTNTNINKNNSYIASYSSGSVSNLTLNDIIFTSNKYKQKWYTTVDTLDGESLEFDTDPIKVSEEKGNVCYIEGGGELQRAIQGPTGSSESDILTIVTNGNLIIDGAISGNVRILAKGSVTLSNTAVVQDGSYLMIVANGGLNIYRSIKYGLLATAGNVVYNIADTANGSHWEKVNGIWTLVYDYTNNSYFYGQILAEGSVSMNVGTIVYSNLVSQHAGFYIPQVSS